MIYKIWESTKASLTRQSKQSKQNNDNEKGRTSCQARDLLCGLGPLLHSFIPCIWYPFWPHLALPFAAWIPIPLLLHHCRQAQVTSDLERGLWQSCRPFAGTCSVGPTTAVPSHLKRLINGVLTLNITTSHWELCFRVRIHLQSSHSPGKDGQTSCSQVWHLLQGQAEKSHDELPSGRKQLIKTS